MDAERRCDRQGVVHDSRRVCPFCSALDRGVFGLVDENIFSKGDVFSVDDQKLDLSYDDVLSAPLHVNCRCTLLPVRP
jgi:hypothetical protein